jgi:hypothetical protein
MGTDDDGLPTPASRGGDGSYHIIGSLTTSPPTALKKALANCNSLCGVLSGSKVLLVCPIPRYVTKGCCDDPTHVTNISGPEYDDELLDFQDQHRKILATWGTANGLNYDMIDPTCSVNPTEPTLRNRVTSSGCSLWGRGDGVHLSPGGYQDLAWTIGESADNDLSSDGMSCALKGPNESTRNQW